MSQGLKKHRGTTHCICWNRPCGGMQMIWSTCRSEISRVPGTPQKWREWFPRLLSIPKAHRACSDGRIPVFVVFFMLEFLSMYSLIGNHSQRRRIFLGTSESLKHLQTFRINLRGSVAALAAKPCPLLHHPVVRSVKCLLSNLASM